MNVINVNISVSAPMAQWVGAKPQESKDLRVMGSNPTYAIGCGHMVGDMSKWDQYDLK